MYRYLLACMAVAATVFSAAPGHTAETKLIARHGFTVDFRDPANAVDQAVADLIVDTFLDAYPRLVVEFNPAAPRRVILVARPGYPHPATGAFGNGEIVFNPKWFNVNRQDVDSFVHEAMHIVQGYDYDDRPAWLVEGIADYARLRYGTYPNYVRIRIGRFVPKFSYDTPYTNAALFLDWLNRNGYPGIVRKVDVRLRKAPYSSEIWCELTGKDIDALWAESVKDTAVLQADYEAAVAAMMASGVAR